VVARTKLLLTFGSPLDKIAFIFGAQLADAKTRDALAASFQPLILDYDKFRNIPGSTSGRRRTSSAATSILRRLPGRRDRKVENVIDEQATTPLMAHVEYWKNDLLFERMYQGIVASTSPCRDTQGRRVRCRAHGPAPRAAAPRLARGDQRAADPPLRRRGVGDRLAARAGGGDGRPAAGDAGRLRYRDPARVPPGESYLPSLVQLATARAVYLFQVRHAEVAAAAARVLGEERIVKAGVGTADDLKSLKKLVAFHDKSVADLGAIGAAPRPATERRAQPRRPVPRLPHSRRAPRPRTGRGTRSPSSRSSTRRPTPGRAASSIYASKNWAEPRGTGSRLRARSSRSRSLVTR
jgi:hypothetical protein